jgi:hypothetical protein
VPKNEPELPLETKPKQNFAEKFMEYMNQFDERMDERLALRQQKKQAEEIKVKKKRDSIVHTTEIDG